MNFWQYGSLLRDTSISIKVLLPPTILILALGAVSLLAIYGLNEQRTILSEVDDIALERITLIDEFIVLSEQVQSEVFHISVIRFMNLPAEEVQPHYEHLEQGLSDLNVIYGQIITKWPLDETEQEILERMKGPLDDFRHQAQQAAVVVSDNPSFGILLVRSSTVPFAEFRSMLTEFRDYQEVKITRAEIESYQRAKTVSTAIIAVALLIALAGIFATGLISTRLISRPIRSMTDLMRRLAEGELAIAVSDLERRDEIGAMARAVEVFRNNAVEKAQAEKALRESEQRFRNLAQTATDAIISITTDSRIRFFNQAAEQISGYSAEEVLGQDIAMLIPEEYGHRHREAIQRYLKTGQLKVIGQTIELRGLRKGNETFPIELSLSEARVKGEVIFTGIIRDITKRKQAEKALKEYSERLAEMVDERTQELRDAQEQLVRREKLAVLGQLAGSVAHELRTPLGNIRNTAYFLSMILESPNSEVKNSLDILDRQVTISDRIISSLLDFARTRERVQQNVDINAVLQEVLADTDVPESVKVVSQLDKSLPSILVDSDQLSQVFDNLIRNAIQAMPEGGQLLVETSMVSENSSQSGWVAISIADTGVGIPKENLDKLFEPLFTTKTRGIGLGLALVKNLIEGNGGIIEVESDGVPGRGSTFIVRLPIREAEVK